ncbi:MAG: methyltransferase [Acidimicrobiales bacterium]|nr:methyltransferase [Acidimicrobiales bacterium]
MERQPHETIWQLATATVASRTLHVVAELGVADHIDEAPVLSKELATRCGADAGALDRALMLLAAHGVFDRVGDAYAHTDASRLLRSDHPSSMRAFPRMMGMTSFSTSLGHLEHSVRTGEPAFGLVEPDGLFAHLQRHEDEARIFDASMTAKAAGDTAAILAAYDFSRFSTIADIGGGRGHLLRAVLEAAPNTTGILFELPAVIDAVDTPAERFALHAGDFFSDALPAADAFILMEVVHDWDDDQAATILSAVRRAAAPGATVLIIEAVADEEVLDPVVRTLDMIMLAITGGRERTAAELDQLLASVGFRDTRILPTPSPLRIVEAVAV